MKELFTDYKDFNDDISAWDTSSVKNMTSMFEQASAFNQPIGSWDVSNVIKMDMMFANSPSFNQDLSGWNVGKVDDMSIMFDQALAFDQDLGWCMQSDVQMDDDSEGWTPFDGTPCFDARCGVHVKGVDC
jgi:surface protein